MEIPGTIAAEYAAEYWANMLVEGQEEGGWKGITKEYGAGLMGGFASLWLPETALQTGLTLATAGLGVAAHAGRLGIASKPIMKGFHVLSVVNGAKDLGEAAIGRDITGQELTLGQRRVKGAFAVLSLGIVATRMGAANKLFGKAGSYKVFGTRGKPGYFNRGRVRLGISDRPKSLKDGMPGPHFSLHGGGKLDGWHLYFNHFRLKSGQATPYWAHAALHTIRGVAVTLSGLYGWQVGGEINSLSRKSRYPKAISLD